MELFIKCALTALLAGVSATMLKRYLPEISMTVLIMASGFLLASISGLLSQVIDIAKKLAQISGVSNEILEPVLKVSAVSVLSKISCDVCRDTGAGALVTVVELCASVVAIILSAPLFDAVIGIVTRM